MSVKLLLRVLCLSEERNEVSTATIKLIWIWLNGISYKKVMLCTLRLKLPCVLLVVNERSDEVFVLVCFNVSCP